MCVDICNFKININYTFWVDIWSLLIMKLFLCLQNCFFFASLVYLLWIITKRSTTVISSAVASSFLNSHILYHFYTLPYELRFLCFWDYAYRLCMLFFIFVAYFPKCNRKNEKFGKIEFFYYWFLIFFHPVWRTFDQKYGWIAWMSLKL